VVVLGDTPIGMMAFVIAVTLAAMDIELGFAARETLPCLVLGIFLSPGSLGSSPWIGVDGVSPEYGFEFQPKFF
jgi:hypothetical protein